MCKLTNTTIGPCSRFFAHHIRPHSNKKSKPRCPGIYMKPTAYDVTATSGRQPQNNMTTLAKIDIFDLMMIIRLIINIFWTWMGRFNILTYTPPCITNKISKVTERTNQILDTLSTVCTQPAFTHASRLFLLMFSMLESKPEWWW